jgi:D-serine deaminase-like pyridoxal phosphate-dependent protein
MKLAIEYQRVDVFVRPRVCDVVAKMNLLDYSYRGIPGRWQVESPDASSWDGIGLDDLLKPVMTLDEGALANNLRVVMDFCRRSGARIAPHTKTAMSPEIARDQLDAGAVGLTVSTVSQVRVLVDQGFRRILIANQVMDPVGVSWLRHALDSHPDLELACFVDSNEGLSLLSHEGDDTNVDVYVEYGPAGGRAGVRRFADVVAMCERVMQTPGVTLRGLAGWEGILGADRTAPTDGRVSSYIAQLCRAMGELSGKYEGLELTVGGSSFTDLVVAEVQDRWPLLLRCGCAFFHDSGYFAGVSPLADSLRPAIQVWSHVQSVPEPDLTILGVGRRDVGSDMGLPTVELIRHADGHETHVEGAEVVGLNDQHALVRGGPGFRPGDLLGLGISHPCTTLDRWRLIPVLDDQRRVTRVIRTFF